MEEKEVQKQRLQKTQVGDGCGPSICEWLVGIDQRPDWEVMMIGSMCSEQTDWMQVLGSCPDWSE